MDITLSIEEKDFLIAVIHSLSFKVDSADNAVKAKKILDKLTAKKVEEKK